MGAESVALNEVLSRLFAFPGSAHDCGYLQGRVSVFDNRAGAALSGADYHRLLDANFRRAGVLFYRPNCDGCTECRQMRVLVDEFEPTKSQRRCLRRNLDLTVSVAPPSLDDEKADLYARYVRVRHDGGPQVGARNELEEFLYHSAVPTLEVEYREPNGRLVGVSILDVGREFASSVYHYFDPAEKRRSIGVYSVLAEIAFCRARGLKHYYLGYLIRGSKSMRYKADYRPFEWLIDGTWQRVVVGEAC